MKADHINISLVESYFSLLKDLNINDKTELIKRLSESIKKRRRKKADSLESLYGSFKSEKSAEEIVKEIRESRTFNRKIEEF